MAMLRSCMVEFDCVVVGAGIHGSCTAFWLRELGVERVAVFEQFGPGHERGSSHGATRITRSSYDVPEFVALAAEAHDWGWPALERALARPLRVATPGVFFGPADGPIAGYARATAGRGVVDTIDARAARARFPLLRFAAGELVLVDRSAAVLLAAATLAGLREWLAARGVTFAWQTRVERVAPTTNGVEIHAGGARHCARHVVLACGPWTGRLGGAAAPTEAVTVVRQQVGYFDVDAAPAAVAPGAFPVWAHIGDGPEQFTYGLPSVDGGGLKAAQHRTTGPASDPDAAAPPVDHAALLALARERFACPVRSLRATETCLYTMAPGHALHVTRAPAAPVTTIAACSGHAFKFGPVLGRRAAALACGR
jgi:cysteine desulfurase/selenocysteine lyase